VTKFASFAEYPARSLAGAEAALLTAWASLNRYHDNMVLVGGLAVKYLMKTGAGLLPGPVTMDVDLGVALATEGGQYGTIEDDLTGQGFKRDKNGRYAREFAKMPVFIDFLTEHPGADHGTVLVDGVSAGVFRGLTGRWRLGGKFPLKATIFLTWSKNLKCPSQGLVLCWCSS